jgi:hypothetical protein
MAGTHKCNSAVTEGRLSKAVEFLDAAELVEDGMPNAAGDLFVDAGIAASDVICCVRLGVHSSSGMHSEAVTLLATADKGSEKHLSTLLGLKNKAALHPPGAVHRRVQEDESRRFPSSRGGQTGRGVSRPARP